MSGNERANEPPPADVNGPQLMDVIAGLQRMMETMQQRLDMMEINNRANLQAQPFPPPEEEAFEHDPYPAQRAPRQAPRRGERVEDDDLSGIKMEIPNFSGRNDAEIYLEWERKVEMVFDCHRYSELKKVKLAAARFNDYALLWWDQLVISRRRNRERSIVTWEEMRNAMRRRFVPAHFHREVHQRLRRLVQGNRNVEDYYKEMEMLMIRAGIEEDPEATMERFIGGLHLDIQDRVETHQYGDIEDLLHLAIKIEQQLKRKGKSGQKFGSTSQGSRPDYVKPERSLPHPTNEPKSDVSKHKNTHTGNTNPPLRTRDIKCYKCLGNGHFARECPNRRTMVIRTNGELVSDDDEVDDSQPAKVMDDDYASDGMDQFPAKGELLVARRALNINAKEETDEQRENIFHTRAYVQGKVCILIIDGGSCTNVASTSLVEKLNLSTTKHPRPYKLQWLNDSGETRVFKQVRVPFRIGKYEDEVLCDVVPMQADLFSRVIIYMFKVYN
ncbi:PREDICTED: uncharacterized protein LOC104818534 [Tarenaya hassleriana]|uniref:uncharacterized protein LOC104818534 n=1 Tax=Tarenaya hassleriana TaxID=28532 RepID=UPI00053CA5DD|nr:PREDICTED: uncharacterized protein LOC104818534 [Tarenaya hassleriana]